MLRAQRRQRRPMHPEQGTASASLLRFFRAVRALLAVAALVDLALARALVAFTHGVIIASSPLRARSRDRGRATSRLQPYSWPRAARNPRPDRVRPCPRRNRTIPDARDRSQRPPTREA